MEISVSTIDNVSETINIVQMSNGDVDVLTNRHHSISTEEMCQLNYEVDANKRNPAEVVREWLRKKGL